jgi:hypothetical protein
MDAPAFTQDQVQRLIEARAAHEELGLATYDEVIREVADRIDEAKSVGKIDVGALLFWKRLRADTKWVREFMTTPENEVRAVTRRTVAAARDGSTLLAEASREARASLSELPGFGVGDALASAVIFACAPDRMAVYDRRAHQGLRKLNGVDVGDRPGRYGRYMAQLASLVDAVNAVGSEARWVPRDVDLALYVIGRPEAE